MLQRRSKVTLELFSRRAIRRLSLCALSFLRYKSTTSILTADPPNFLSLNWDQDSRQYVLHKNSTEQDRLHDSDDLDDHIPSLRRPSYRERYADSYQNKLVSSNHQEQLQLFLSTLHSSDISRASFMLEKIIALDLWATDPSVPEDCLLLLVSSSLSHFEAARCEPNLTFFDIVSNLISLYVTSSAIHNSRFSRPNKAMAYVLHRACGLSDSQEKADTISRLAYLWTHKFKLSLDPVLEHYDMLTESDRQLVKLVSGSIDFQQNFLISI